MYDFDLFTIGGGSGGVRASRMAAQFGAKVAKAGQGGVDAALGALADLVVDLVEMVDHADLEALDPAAE